MGWLRLHALLINDIRRVSVTEMIRFGLNHFPKQLNITDNAVATFKIYPQGREHNDQSRCQNGHTCVFERILHELRGCIIEGILCISYLNLHVDLNMCSLRIIYSDLKFIAIRAALVWGGNKSGYVVIESSR